MIMRLLPRRPSSSIISSFITRHRPFLSLNPNHLLTGGQGKFRNTFGIRLNVRCMSVSASSSSPSSVPVLSEKQVDNVLAAKEDEHGGVIVEMSTEPMDSIVFTSLLKASIMHWKQQGKRGVWIKLPIELVNLIEPVVKEGFYYHHAEPKHLMLVHWIPETTNTLPANASHRVGIGAFVMNENGEVLVVQEKSGKFQGTGIWKFPTGVVDEGEDICSAAVREVKEETGIDTKFVEVLSFRQSHKSFFDKSDLFFMCMLQPLSFNIQMQEREIEAAQWMSFEDYASQEFVQKHDLLRYIAKLCIAKRDGKYSGFSPVPTITSFSNKPSNLYFNNESFDGKGKDSKWVFRENEYFDGKDEDSNWGFQENESFNGKRKDSKWVFQENENFDGKSEDSKWVFQENESLDGKRKDSKWVWKKMRSLRDGKLSREAIDAVGCKGKLYMVNVNKEGFVYDVNSDGWSEMPAGMLGGWRGPAAAMDEETMYVVDESEGVLRKYDDEMGVWVDVLANGMLKGAERIAAGGGRVCMVRRGGVGILVVDVVASPPRLWVVDTLVGHRVLALHILPRMCPPEFQSVAVV